MKLLVCIKAVQSRYAGGKTARTEKYVVNPYDLFALCKAIELKQYGASVTCVCMGSGEMKNVLYKCLAVGADEAVLISDSSFAGSDTYATSYILQKAIEKIEHDFVICGDKSVDGETGQVVFNLGSRLNYYCVGNVSNATHYGNRELRIEVLRNKQTILGTIKAPAIIVFNDLIAEMSVSLFSLKKAKNKSITVLRKDDIDCDCRYIGQEGSKTKVIASKNIRAERKTKSMKENTLSEVVQFIHREMERTTSRIESDVL